MEQQEQREWDAVNRLLQHHGFKPVNFADPTENKNLAELVLLERKSASDVRLMLKTMLSDSERRQGLIQELIQSNSQLKEEVQQHQTRAARQSQRAAELEGILDGVKVKVQDLEDSYIGKSAQQHSQFQQLQQEKRDAEKRCQSLEQKLSQEKEKVSQLQKKLQYAVREEERRVARQNQAFQQIHRRSARLNSTTDQQILDIIDMYESQMQQLRNELKLYKSSSGEKDSSNSQKNRSTVEKGTTDTSSNYKALLKSYQEQLKETKAQRKELRTEIQRLKEDLESRPTIKELKTCKQQLRRLDRIIQQSNLRPSQALKSQDSAEMLNTNNTGIQHLDASTCKRLLMDLCKELHVQDVSHLISAVKVQCKQPESAFKLEKILHDITTVLTNPRAPLGLLRQRAQTNLELSREVEFELIVPTLEVWSRQLTSLADLHRALIRLEKRLLPWQPEGSITAPSDPVRMEDLMLIVDTLLDETASDDKVLRSPTRYTLESMVAHFQKLFDTPSLTGIYPRMNEVYTKLGEMNNAMRNLRDVLDLDDKAPPSEVMNKVAAIVSQSGNATGHELYSLLESSDIDSIIVKLKEHEEFFPVFHSFILELLQTLGENKLHSHSTVSQTEMKSSSISILVH
ncbi:centrosomal protein of 70 kDa isoform X1 [Sinocyclocheilus anshuiensis]|uniref:centrosomal protein of 70 kDa isoform X1 n=1 Tax=Sinocyclocheilus anshuiensis TaxID=1608454 RepID=UPI0007B903E9|nr:PREDICTED: centrosomal protein of 70 kDa isoform X1 [Sinocyclocheilus anshuiensis]XP_016295823.1 PREDICTED: centrosomal protein of 70 kDa isoform X1 [Sinocyclocheilus anshuiensis]